MYIANGMGVNELTSCSHCIDYPDEDTVYLAEERRRAEPTSFELRCNLSRRAPCNSGIGQRVSRTHFTQSMGSTLEESDMQRKEWDRFYELTSFE